jgi:hypothetical protein
MQTRREGNLIIGKGTRTLRDGIDILAGAGVVIGEEGTIFTYRTTCDGIIAGSGRIFVHVSYKPVGGDIEGSIIVIYYPRDPFVLPVIFGTIASNEYGQTIIAELT